MADWPMIKIEAAWSRRARRRGAYGVPRGWRDVTKHVFYLMTVDNDKEAYEEALRRYWRAHPRPLAADGLSYHRRSLARKRRSR